VCADLTVGMGVQHTRGRPKKVNGHAGGRSRHRHRERAAAGLDTAARRQAQAGRAGPDNSVQSMRQSPTSVCHFSLRSAHACMWHVSRS
jgi:hypothetical protein